MHVTARRRRSSPTKSYFAGLIVSGAIVASGCGLYRTDLGPILVRKRPKPVLPAEQPEPAAKAWTPQNTKLSPEFVDSVKFLLAHGLADPRRGTFSKVKWPFTFGTGFTTYYGWDVPQPDGRRKLICMDGVSRYVSEVPKPVKIDAVLDDRNLMYTPDDTGNSRVRITLVSAMFLIAGRPDIARRLLASEGPQPAPGILELSEGLLNSKWTHALGAYFRGDDESAVNLLQELAALRETYEMEAQRALASSPQQRAQLALMNRAGGLSNTNMLEKGGPRSIYIGAATGGRLEGIGGGVGFPGVGFGGLAAAKPRLEYHELQRRHGSFLRGTVFGFLDQVPSLISDIKRRLGETSYDKPAEIAGLRDSSRLIHDLELAVNNSTFQQRTTSRYMGVVPLSNLEGPLEGLGDAGLEALIDCIENDKRFVRDAVPNGRALSVVPVSDLAVQAFLDLTHVSLPNGDRDSVLAAIKKWWVSNKRLSKAERAYRILRDDKATLYNWVQAANVIVPPESDWSSKPLAARIRENHERESLRTHSAPSVTDILSKRILELVNLAGSQPLQPEDPGQSSLPPWSPVDTAMELCDNLWNWDPQSSLPAIRAASSLAYQQYKQRFQISQFQTADTRMFVLFERRLELNDPSVMGEYTDLMRLYGLYGSVDAAPLHYFYDHRAEPRFRGFGQAVLLEPALYPVDPKRPYRGILAVTVARSPLLSLPEERQALLHLLHDKTVLGSFVSNYNGVFRNLLDGTPPQPQFIATGEPVPPPNQIVEFRRCDQAMEGLSGLNGLQHFRPWWAVSQKDRIIEQTCGLIQAIKSENTALLPWPGAIQTSQVANGADVPNVTMAALR